MAFAILYGFVCGCFLSLSPAVAAQLWGSGRLAGLSGLMLLFNLPGESSPKLPPAPRTTLMRYMFVCPAHRELLRGAHRRRNPERDGRELDCGFVLLGRPADPRRDRPFVRCVARR